MHQNCSVLTRVKKKKRKVQLIMSRYSLYWQCLVLGLVFSLRGETYDFGPRASTTPIPGIADLVTVPLGYGTSSRLTVKPAEKKAHFRKAAGKLITKYCLLEDVALS